VPATSPIEANLIETFSSVQGEGVLIGCRQIFVRFADCNLNCAYCDTPFAAGPAFALEVAPGSGRFETCANPADLNALSEQFRAWEKTGPGLHHSVCLTGGEPLLQAAALARWLPALAKLHPVYLETNGTLPDELGRVLPWLKWVSMDLKTEETTGRPADWGAHAAFMQLAKERLCHVKLVVGEQTSVDKVRRAAAFVAAHAAGTPLILQPCMAGRQLTVHGPFLLELQAGAAAEHPDTRLIPQVHPLLEIA
jgi:organic radical activating enzyme